MKVSAASRFFTRLITNLAAIVAVSVIFAAGATKAGFAANEQTDTAALYASKPH